MDNQKKIEDIIGKIAEGKYTDADLSQLRELLSASDRESLIQLGKNIVGKIDGREIQIGDRIYQDADAEAIKQALRLVLQEKQKAARPRNEKLLLQAVKDEVVARLKQSLHNAVLINLGKKAQPEQVKRPWSSDIKIGNKPSEPIPDDITVLEIFDQEEIAGKLLILGNPGAGKTTTMLDLAQALIARAKQEGDYPIPVLFNLSNWKDGKQSICDWLIAELKSKYGVRKDIGAKWISDAKLLPMLDGLDELESLHQEPCVQKINEFLQSEHRPQYVVVCSRWEEYKSYEAKLKFNGAVYLSPLNSIQIQSYLENVGISEFWYVINNNSMLLELAKSPLILSIITISLNQISLEQLPKDKASSLKFIFDVYIQQMLERDIFNKLYDNEPKYLETKRWLSWLSHRLECESQAEFEIEKIQPEWLKNRKQKWFYRIGVIVFGGIVCGLIIAPITGLKTGIIIGIIGWTLQTPYQIRPIETLRFSVINLFQGLWIGVKNILLFPTLLLALLFFFFNVSLNDYTLILFFFLALVIFYGFFIGITYAISQGLSGPEFQSKKIPNHGIWKSVSNSLIFALILGITGAFFWGIIVNPLFGTILGIVFGFIGSLSVSNAWMQHFILRIILWCSGDIPWNYAKFLNYATDRLFLQVVGNRYRFIHELLKKHFSQLSTTSSILFMQSDISLRRQPPNRLITKSIKIFKKFCFVVLLFTCNRAYLLEMRYLASSKMMPPTLQAGDRILIDLLTYKFRNPQRGEIITFKVNDKFSSDFVQMSRIIGLPGEIVVVKGRRIYINEKPLYKDYVDFPLATDAEIIIKIPPDSYLVIGDNRSYEIKSLYSLVTKTSIIGRATSRLFPLERISKL